MSIFRIVFTLLFASFFTAPVVCAQKAPTLKPIAEGVKPGEWTLDWEAAKKYAAEKDLPIFLFFTGAWNAQSDTIKSQVFTQPEWKKYAKDNLVLVWVDVPEPRTNKPGVPAKFAEVYKLFGKLRASQVTPGYLVLDSDGKTKLGDWFRVEKFYTPEYFSDLVKSHVLTRKPKEAPEAAGAKPVRPAPAVPKPAPAGAIRPLFEGARPGAWTADFEAAQKAAAQSGSLIFVYFTGSDWNRQAQAVTKAIFARPAWDKFAKDNNLFLVYVDLPENTSLVPEKFAEKHTQLRKGYLTRGAFPSCVLLASDGIVKLTGVDKTIGDMTHKSLTDAIKPHLAE